MVYSLYTNESAYNKTYISEYSDRLVAIEAV